MDDFTNDIQCEDFYQYEIDLADDKFFIEYINKGVSSLDEDDLEW